MAKQQLSLSGLFLAFLVVLPFAGCLALIVMPPGCGIPDKAKEAEVKQNLHAIQLALERYAVDHDGQYPMFIMGGDWTDSYAVWQGWADANGLENPEVEFATPGMGDALVMESYMPTFPQNPFKKVNKSKLRRLIEHCNHLGEITSRFVGGTDRNLMVEVFGPQFIQADQAVSGDFFVHHIFTNPPYDIYDMRKENCVDWNNPVGNELLVGNFSYTPISDTENGCWLSPNSDGENETPAVKGYTLAGYGSIRTKSMDVYNRNGNYKGRYRTEPCETDCSDAQVYLDDIPCICPGDGNLEPNPMMNNGGSDTLPDGVVITLDSGVLTNTWQDNSPKTEGS